MNDMYAPLLQEILERQKRVEAMLVVLIEALVDEQEDEAEFTLDGQAAGSARDPSEPL